jgi:hypothetical protein
MAADREQEREAFEQWFSSQPINCNRRPNRQGDGYYTSSTDWMWQAWLARAAIAGAAPADRMHIGAEELTLQHAYAEGRRDEQEGLSSVLPGTTYMDPPDGGAPTILEQLQRQAKDAARYRWLRQQDWFDGELCVLRDPKKVLTRGIGLGADCPSLDRLDAAIDAAMNVRGAKEPA